MKLDNDITIVYRFLFEDLLKRYIDLENKIKRQSGILSIFNKINYWERANEFKYLMDNATEAKDSLPLTCPEIGDNTIHPLIEKLKECYTLFIDMTNVQTKINMKLHNKSNGESYCANEYTAGIELINMYRYGLECELPKLTSLFTLAVNGLTE